jgi:pimeloyl-ACP methyl ester carboxylesterase
MTTFVLVHGGWHGGWCWKRVVPLLQNEGHVVYTPTLTGMGERAHLASRSVDLQTHVQDVINVLKYEDLANVVLVGHSYGGFIIAGVADRVPKRVAHLVYLDAAVPKDGQSIFSLMPPSLQDAIWEYVRRDGDGWLVPPEADILFDTTFMGISAAADVKWVKPRLTPQPVGTFEQPLRLGNPATEKLSRTYILCTEGSANDPFPGKNVDYIDRARIDPGWRYREIDSGHAAMVTRPRELADLLLETA